MKNQKIVFANDYRGIELKRSLLQYAQDLGLDTEDIGIEEGSPLDYVDITKKLVGHLYNTENLGVLICGSGQGVSMAANRSSSIRAALCHTPEDAIGVRQKLNSNVMCLGSKNSTIEEAKACLEAFVNHKFLAGKYENSALKLNTNATEHASNGVNLIVRALIRYKDHILLTTTTGENKEFSSDLYFLPGGHVDYKEAAVDALRRELKEEMAIEANVMEFKGALECSWLRKGSVYHELNLIYEVEIPNLDLENPPQPTEPVHQFNWVQISKVPELKILPQKLKSLITETTNGDRSIGFYSDMLEDK